jgi:predicted nucleic acid-binding protein
VKLATDASALVAEALRPRGEKIIAHPNLELYISPPTWSEVVHEIGRRFDAMVQHGRLTEETRELTFQSTMALLTRHVEVVPEALYTEYEAAALIRIGHRDPSDWPTIAVALALDAGIWTSDRDFFGCGVPVWSTETLLAYLPQDPASA